MVSQLLVLALLAQTGPIHVISTLECAGSESVNAQAIEAELAEGLARAEPELLAAGIPANQIPDVIDYAAGSRDAGRASGLHIEYTSSNESFYYDAKVRYVIPCGAPAGMFQNLDHSVGHMFCNAFASQVTGENCTEAWHDNRDVFGKL